MKLKLDGWVHIDVFVRNADIYAKGNRRVLVDRDSSEVVCRYLLRKDADDELRSVESKSKSVYWNQ